MTCPAYPTGPTHESSSSVGSDSAEMEAQQVQLEAELKRKKAHLRSMQRRQVE